MIAILIETMIDSIKIVPFLFITYLVIEYMEHKSDDKVARFLKNSRKLGPAIGSILGAIPQCGFSAAASNFYAGKVITLGTLLAVFLSTSDEMLPILLSSGASPKLIIQIIGTKIAVGMAAGIIIDINYNNALECENGVSKMDELRNHEKCQSEGGILVSAAKHAVNIFVFIFIISLLLNIAFFYAGDAAIFTAIFKLPIIGPLLVGLLGIIPNCGASVLITQLYLKGIISYAAMLSGLLVGAGTGLLVLFRVNKNLRQNIRITLMLYGIGVLAGIAAGWGG